MECKSYIHNEQSYILLIFKRNDCQNQVMCIDDNCIFNNEWQFYIEKVY